MSTFWDYMSVLILGEFLREWGSLTNMEIKAFFIKNL